MIYISEAHSTDGWQVPNNIRDSVYLANHTGMDGRAEAAGACVRKLGIEIPALLDDFSNTTESAYTGWPDRLYVIDAAGRIALKSEAGPYGFRPAAVRTALERLFGTSSR